MRKIGIVVLVVGLIFSGAELALANGGGVKKEVIKPAEPVTAPIVTVPSVSKTAALKSPGLAAFLSVIAPGLGQVYNGDIGKALIMGSAEGLCWIMISEDLDAIGVFGLIMGRIISPVEAYYSASEKNKGLALNINKEAVLLAYKVNF